MQDAGAAGWLRPGTVLAGRYEIVRPIGRGGFGLVYEAIHRVLRTRLAVKVLGPAAIRTANLSERFRRETWALAQLSSPNVVRIVDSDLAEDGSPFLVMELLLGRDLETEVAERGRLPLAEAVDYVLQAAAGVAEAHAHGVVHRDLKPSNLFLVDEPGGRRVKVLDFGLSKVSAELALTATHSTLGTPLYVSPEQIRSAKYVDVRSDIWSLAVILYRLVSGTTPFEGETATDLLVAISREKPKLLSERVPGVPAELDLLVSKALRKRPVERFTDMQDFARALAPFGSVLAAAAAAQGPASSAIPAPPSSARRPEGARVSSTFLESSKDLPPESRTHRAVSIGLIVMAAALFATLVLGLGARWLAPGLGHTDDAAADDTASQKPRAFPAGPSASTAPASSAAPAPSTPVRIVPFATAAPVIAPSAAAASSEEATKPPPAQRAKRRPRRSDLGF